MKLKTGDDVFITYMGKTVRGIVLLASRNGDSAYLEFEAVLGGYLGGMPILRGNDGTYRDLIADKEVTVTTVESHEKARPS